ncbi:MAG: permease-like cell division protein FtsX [Clostridia bacterium]|nr:permease-like cell division protein FtsX [Clostridia bacterium]
MNYNILNYLISEGFKNVFKNKKSTFAAIIIMFATMITMGLGIAGAKNITSIMKQLEQDVPIKLYIKDDVQKSELADIEDYIKSIEYVNSVVFTTKAEALQAAKEKLSESANLLDTYNENNHPFKASYAITLTNLNESSKVVETLNSAEILKDKIEKIESSDIIIEGLNSIDKGIKIIFLCMGILLIIVSTVIISNTIKLTVHARRKEISIMKYVGATNNFIRAPFIVEGIVIGIIAIAISILSLGCIYHLIYNSCNNILMTKFNFIMLQFNDIFQSIIIVYSLLGIGIGVLGSILSMKKYLKV